MLDFRVCILLVHSIIAYRVKIFFQLKGRLNNQDKTFVEYVEHLNSATPPPPSPVESRHHKMHPKSMHVKQTYIVDNTFMTGNIDTMNWHLLSVIYVVRPSQPAIYCALLYDDTIEWSHYGSCRMDTWTIVYLGVALEITSNNALLSIHRSNT